MRPRIHFVFLKSRPDDFSAFSRDIKRAAKPSEKFRGFRLAYKHSKSFYDENTASSITVPQFLSGMSDDTSIACKKVGYAITLVLDKHLLWASHEILR